MTHAPGWRVPDGGSNGIWSKSGFGATTYASTNEGMLFSISSPSTTWYPASGSLSYNDSVLFDVSDYSGYWSASPFDYYSYYLGFNNFGNVGPSDRSLRASGLSIRCLRESK